MSTASVIDESVSCKCYTDATGVTVVIYFAASTIAVMVNFPDLLEVVCERHDGKLGCCTFVSSCNVKVVEEAVSYCRHARVVSEYESVKCGL